MRILVTGGLGFIGSAVCRRLIKETENEVISIDKGSYAANSESVKEIMDNERFINIIYDLSNPIYLLGILESKKPDGIIHLAAETHVDRSIVNPRDFIESNIMGTFNLLECVKNKPNIRFHYVSTDEVFGSMETIKSFSEESPLNPKNPYSATKASAENLVRAYINTFGIDAAITNCCNNYGPWQNQEKLIPKAIMNAIEGERIPIYGTGSGIRDWIYVEDHVSALLAVFFSEEHFSGETYCIGANESSSALEIVLEICKILDKKIPKKIPYSDLISFVEDRPGADLIYSLNTNKIATKLGWHPKETIKNGLESTVDWYIDRYRRGI